MTDVLKQFLNGVNVFFILYLIGYSTILFLSVMIGSSYLYARKKEKNLRNELMKKYYLPISIIVPAHNEEITVADTVRSLLSLDYTIYEIIVVDDGSKDHTAAKLIEAFHMHKVERPIRRQIRCMPEKAVYEAQGQKVPITLIQKVNGGKADALNMGINACQYPYFISIDADSVLQHDSLREMIIPILEDSKVIAVGGLVQLSNGVRLKEGHVVSYSMPKRLLPSMQVLEYDRSFLASRIFFDQFNGNLIISGAIGLFQREMVISAGGYDSQTMGEDMELVVKLHLFCRINEIPYSIRYASSAICWSQAPETFADLCRQRRRWYIGLFQVMWKHRQIFGDPKYGLVSFISYIYYLLYELLSPFIELFGLATIVLAAVMNLINVPFMILFFGVYAVFGAVLTLTAFLSRIHTQNLKLSFTDIMKAILLCLGEISVLRFILAAVRMTALIGYRKKKLNWEKIKRRKIDYE